MKNIKLIIIEDRPDIVEYVKYVLRDVEDIDVIAQYSSAEDALLSPLVADADVSLVDIMLPGITGVEYIRQAEKKYPTNNFIVHTMSENSRDLIDALAVGAVGYILKGCSKEELVECVRTVGAGGAYINPRMARRLVYHYKKNVTDDHSLSKPEMFILEKLKSGTSYDQIAEEMDIPLTKVHNHIKSIYKKIN